MTEVHPQRQHSAQRHRSSSDADEVVEYLQLAGRRYQEHVELLRQEQEVRDAQHAPFKPTISAYAEQASKKSVVRQGSSIGDRLHELHQRRLALLAEEAAAAAQQREAADRSACSFAPVVTARAEHASRGGDGSSTTADVSTALHRWEEQRRARQARRQLEATRTEMSTVTGVPRISAYALEKAAVERAHRSVSIETSLLAEAAARRQRQHAAFEERHGPASSSGTTVAHPSSSSSSPRFTPVISSYASGMRFQHGVVDRLYTHHHQQQQQQSFDEEKALHCTFQPRLSPQSTELSRRYHEEEGEEAINAHERLHRNTHHTSKYRKSMLPEAASGVPEISEASRRMVEERRRELALSGDPGALGHSPGSRLYPQKSSTSSTQSPPRPTFKKKVVTARDVELQTALTFAPAVSAQSDAMWRQRVTALKSSGVARNEEEARQLLWRKAEKKRDEEVSKMQAQRRREEAGACTFHPVAGRPPHRRSGYMAMPIEARTQMWAQQRDARLSELRREVDGSALEECSFHPHVDPVFPLPRPEAQPATGVEEFVERQAEARRQREEAKEWWRPQYARTMTRTASSSHVDSKGQRGQPAGAVRASSVDASLLSSSSSAAQQRRARRSGPRGPTGAGSPLRRTATAASTRRTNTTTTEDEEEEEEFVQHWAPRAPPSTSLTASSFSRASQPDVPSAESTPRQAAYVVLQQQQQQQPVVAVAGVNRSEASSGPYRWRPSSTPVTSAPATAAWRKPLRYRAQ